MKLTTTRNLIVERNESKWMDMVRFDSAYQDIDPDQEVSLLDMLNNGINTVQDVIWCLRATKQDSKHVSVEFAKRCAARAKRRSIYYETIYVKCRQGDVMNALNIFHYSKKAANESLVCAKDAESGNSICSIAAADAAAICSVDPTNTFKTSNKELQKQKHDLMELLS